MDVRDILKSRLTLKADKISKKYDNICYTRYSYIDNRIDRIFGSVEHMRVNLSRLIETDGKLDEKKLSIILDLLGDRDNMLGLRPIDKNESNPSNI